MKKFLDLYPKFVSNGSVVNWIGRGLRKMLIADNLGQPLPEDPDTREQVAAIVILSTFPFSHWKKAFPIVFKEISDQEDLLKHLSKFKKLDYISSYKFLEKRARIGDFLGLAAKNASIQLLNLAEGEMLPSFCPLHEKIFWSRCSLCHEPPKPSPEEEASSERMHLKDVLEHEKVSDQEIYFSLMKDAEIMAGDMALDLKKEEKLEIHKKVLESEVIQDPERKGENDI